jgi:hypothetical protein
MSANRKNGGRPSLREDRNRHRLQHTARRLELVIAALRERPLDRARRLDALEPSSPRSPRA